MKRYHLLLTVKIMTVALLSITTGYLLGIHQYWIALGIFIVLVRTGYGLLLFMKRTFKDTSRLINAIRFSESNISFQYAVSKGLPPELSLQMENAITRLNKKMMQTEAEHQFYDTLLNRIDSAIVVFEKSGKIHWINKTAVDEFGRPQPINIEDLRMVSPELPSLLDKISPQETKIIRIEKENHLRQLAITAVLFSSQGKNMKLVSFKHIESVMEESETDAWKKLIRVLTHEIMNSITPIISLSESFSEQDSNDEERQNLMKRAMQTIHRRSKGLVEFVHNYQKLTRIPAPVLREENFSEIIEDISQLMKAENIRFTYEVTPPDILVPVDRSQIEQVLINLIKNAWEASLNKPVPDIQVHIFKNEYQRPVITIEDNGCGILPEVVDKIFVPFFTTKTGGSGIGLSICRQIMTMHGGNIRVESVIDHGTKVELRF